MKINRYRQISNEQLEQFGFEVQLGHRVLIQMQAADRHIFMTEALPWANQNAKGYFHVQFVDAKSLGFNLDGRTNYFILTFTQETDMVEFTLFWDGVSRTPS